MSLECSVSLTARWHRTHDIVSVHSLVPSSSNLTRLTAVIKLTSVFRPAWPSARVNNADVTDLHSEVIINLMTLFIIANEQ